MVPPRRCEAGERPRCRNRLQHRTKGLYLSPEAAEMLELRRLASLLLVPMVSTFSRSEAIEYGAAASNLAEDVSGGHRHATWPAGSQREPGIAHRSLWPGDLELV